jgi:hypothetical protein
LEEKKSSVKERTPSFVATTSRITADINRYAATVANTTAKGKKKAEKDQTRI